MHLDLSPIHACTDHEIKKLSATLRTSERILDEAIAAATKLSTTALSRAFASISSRYHATGLPASRSHCTRLRDLGAKLVAEETAFTDKMITYIESHVETESLFHRDESGALISAAAPCLDNVAFDKFAQKARNALLTTLPGAANRLSEAAENALDNLVLNPAFESCKVIIPDTAASMAQLRSYAMHLDYGNDAPSALPSTKATFLQWNLLVKDTNAFVINHLHTIDSELALDYLSAATATNDTCDRLLHWSESAKKAHTNALLALAELYTDTAMLSNALKKSPLDAGQWTLTLGHEEFSNIAVPDYLVHPVQRPFHRLKERLEHIQNIQSVKLAKLSQQVTELVATKPTWCPKAPELLRELATDSAELIQKVPTIVIRRPESGSTASEVGTMGNWKLHLLASAAVGAGIYKVVRLAGLHPALPRPPGARHGPPQARAPEATPRGGHPGVRHHQRHTPTVKKRRIASCSVHGDTSSQPLTAQTETRSSKKPTSTTATTSTVILPPPTQPVLGPADQLIAEVTGNSPAVQQIIREITLNKTLIKTLKGIDRTGWDAERWKAELVKLGYLKLVRKDTHVVGPVIELLEAFLTMNGDDQTVVKNAI